MTYEKKYKSGLRLVVDENLNSNSVAFNMYLNVGSVNELDEEEYGISHFIEHMLFKSTKNFSANKLNKEFNTLGITPNAYTSKTATSYHFKTIKPNLEKAVALMSDMFFNHSFDKDDLEKERNVILEEIAMNKDDIDNLVYDTASESLFFNTSLKHPILGYEETVKAMTAEDLHNYFKKHYTPNNLVLSFAGKITMEEAQSLAENYFQNHFYQISLPNYSKTVEGELNAQPNYIKIIKNENEQVNISIAIPVTSIYNKNHYISKLLNIAFSYGMSSPLFEKVREQKGYVYKIYSIIEEAAQGSALIISFSTRQKNVLNAVHTIKELMNDISKNGFTEERLKTAKNIIESGLLITLEDNFNAADINAENITLFNEIKTYDKVLAKYNAITLEEINNMAKEVFSNKNVSICYIGKPIKENLLDEFLENTKTLENENLEK